jgi:hypothetical protein
MLGVPKETRSEEDVRDAEPAIPATLLFLHHCALRREAHGLKSRAGERYAVPGCVTSLVVQVQTGRMVAPTYLNG